ncbi:unnamed protein product [Protopolystoma xenopodis]|uniref:Uncharacterized protein n=1 Tax=Protopolystoma xenopodis TaxID=117903 RepID=A0A448WMP1_9PLAT|nr:unnamed protein product [Protopolystoma xenopodis]
MPFSCPFFIKNIFSFKANIQVSNALHEPSSINPPQSNLWSLEPATPSASPDEKHSTSLLTQTPVDSASGRTSGPLCQLPVQKTQLVARLLADRFRSAGSSDVNLFSPAETAAPDAPDESKGLSSSADFQVN